MAAIAGKRLLGLGAIAALTAGLARPARGADDDGPDPQARRRAALEALRDLGQAETDEDFDRALERFNEKAGEERRDTREQLMRRVEPEDDKPEQ